MTSNVYFLHERNGLPRTLTAEEAQVLIRELLAEGGHMVFRNHALDRMEERDITNAQVLQVLRRGEVTKGPTWSAEFGNWTLTMRADAAGELVGVGVAIDTDLMGTCVVILTVFC